MLLLPKLCADDYDVDDCVDVKCYEEQNSRLKQSQAFTLSAKSTGFFSLMH